MDRQRKTEWQRRQRAAFAERNGFSTTANYSAGGQREAVLKRDNYACVQCGMTDEQHKAKWGRPITIDHKSKDRSDNSPGNLQTLCLTCHGRKDLIPRLRARKFDALVPSMQSLRAAGCTYQQIGERLGMSIGTVWTYLNKDAA